MGVIHGYDASQQTCGLGHGSSESIVDNTNVHRHLVDPDRVSGSTHGTFRYPPAPSSPARGE